MPASALATTQPDFPSDGFFDAALDAAATPPPFMADWTVERSDAGLSVRGTYFEHLGAAPQVGYVLTGVREVMVVHGAVVALLGPCEWIHLVVDLAAHQGGVR